MVIGDEKLKVDDRMTISIQLPELPRINATRLALPVRVVRCHPDLSPEYFNIGLTWSRGRRETSHVQHTIPLKLSLFT